MLSGDLQHKSEFENNLEDIETFNIGPGSVGFAFYTATIKDTNLLLGLVNDLRENGCICNPVDEGIVVAGIITSTEQLDLILKIQSENNFFLGLGLPLVTETIRRNRTMPQNANIITRKDEDGNCFINFGGPTITAAVRALQESIKESKINPDSEKIKIFRLNPDSPTTIIKKSTNGEFQTMFDVRDHLNSSIYKTHSPYKASLDKLLKISKQPLPTNTEMIPFTGWALDVDVEASTDFVMGRHGSWKDKWHRKFFDTFNTLEEELKNEYPNLLFGIMRTTESVVIYTSDENIKREIIEKINKLNIRNNFTFKLNVTPHHVHQATLVLEKGTKTVIKSSKPIKRQA